MTTAADHLRAQNARHIIDIVASDLACEKVRIAEPAPIPPRPWVAYAVFALAYYLAGAATALAIVGAP